MNDDPEIHEFTFIWMGESDKAIKVSHNRVVMWLPKSQIEFTRQGKNVVVALPEWLASKNNLLTDERELQQPESERQTPTQKAVAEGTTTKFADHATQAVENVLGQVAPGVKVKQLGWQFLTLLERQGFTVTATKANEKARKLEDEVPF